MNSICFTCKHFKQTAPLDHYTSGYCDWKAPALPHWVQIWLESQDRFYGPHKNIGRGYMHPLKCDTWERAADNVIDKRKSEKWHD